MAVITPKSKGQGQKRPYWKLGGDPSRAEITASGSDLPVRKVGPGDLKEPGNKCLTSLSSSPDVMMRVPIDTIQTEI